MSNDLYPDIFPGAALAVPGAVAHGTDMSGPDQVESQRVNILGVQITPLNLDGVVATLEKWRQQGRREYVCCVSVHGLVTAQRDPSVRNAINGAGMATKDGMPLVWWCRQSGLRNTLRVCGADVMEAMCAAGAQRGYRFYFYGGSQKVLDALIANLTQRHPGLAIVGHKSPPFRTLTDDEIAADIAAINETRPDFVWIGLGMPKQEKWMATHVGKIESAALLGVGAAFDFHAGTKARAPVWMQRIGFEWLFRLLCEPKRLAHRYIIDNSVFVALTLRKIATSLAMSRSRGMSLGND